MSIVSQNRPTNDEDNGGRPRESPRLGSGDEETDQSQEPLLITVTQDGSRRLLAVAELKQYLDAQPHKAEALNAVVGEIAAYVEDEEIFKEWVSEVNDLVAKHEYWAGGRHSSLQAWKDDHQLFTATAKQGKAIRDRRKKAIDSLVSNGVSGPRFEHMVAQCSRTFIEAVRKQVEMHGFSYPLVCALANIKTFHRLKTAGGRGRKGTHTQSRDVSDLETVTFRKLSANDTKSVRTKVGAHGFLVEVDANADAAATPDPAFDTATAAFVSGKAGFDQPEEHARTTPRIAELDSNDDKPERKKTSKKPALVDALRFLFISECSCAAEVPRALRTELDRLASDCGYEEVKTVLPRLAEFRKHLCPRHCQLALVKALGKDRLSHRTDARSLQAELGDCLPKLEYSLDNNAGLQKKFDYYKKSLGFSWSQIDAVKVPEECDTRRATKRESDFETPAAKKKKGDQAT